MGHTIMKTLLQGAVLLGLATFLTPIPEVSAQDAKDTLRVAMYSPATPRGNVYGIQYIWPHSYWWDGVFDAFVRIDDKGQTIPFAAASWENIDPRTWRVTFRPDIEFGSSRKNDAANIVKAFDYLHSDAAKGAGIMRNMKLASYRRVSDQTVEFVTVQPDPLLVQKFAAFYVADMAAFTEMGVAAFSVKPVTSGPFQVTSWNDQEMVATAYAKSWRPAKTKNLRIVNVPEAVTRMSGLISNEMDIAFNMGPDDVAGMRAAGHTVAIESAPFVSAIALFTEDFAKKWPNGKAPFSDKRVRQAVNYAVNRDAIVKEYLKGMARAAGQPATQATFGFNPDVKPYPYDPQKARQLLAEAGYGNGLNMLMESTAVTAGASDILQIVAEDLKRVGVNLTVQVMPFAERSKRFNGNSWAGDLTSFSMFFSPTMDASTPFSVYGCNLPNTFTCIPELTSLIAAQEKEMDPKKRLDILQELMKRQHEEAMALPLNDGFDITGVAKRVTGYKNWNKVIHYENMSVGG